MLYSVNYSKVAEIQLSNTRKNLISQSVAHLHSH